MDGVAILAAFAADAAPAVVPSPDTDLAPLGSPEDREPSEPQPPSDEDDNDAVQEKEHGQAVDDDSGDRVLAGDDLKRRIIKQACSHSLSFELLSLYIFP